MTLGLKLAGTMGVGLVLMGAFLMAARADAKRFKTERDASRAVVASQQAALENLEAAHAAELASRDAAARASTQRAKELETAISDAERRANEARKTNANLDQCLSVDFGFDFTGGLLNDADRSPDP